MKNDNIKIILNTGLLFFKLVVCIILGLLQTRFVLAALGISDFGIFSLVGSCVSMLSFFNTAMSMSTQRFISYSIGENDQTKTEVVYVTAKTLLYRIAFAVLLLLEIVMFSLLTIQVMQNCILFLSQTVLLQVDILLRKIQLLRQT